MKFSGKLAIILVAVTLLPQAGFSSSKFVVKPRFSSASRFDSNFYLTKDNERAVYTYLVQPGIQLGIEAPKTKAYIDYTFEAYFYRDKDSVSSNEDPASSNDYFGHLVNFSASHNLTPRITLGFDDTFYRTLYPYNYDRLSDNIEKRQYDINRLTPSFLYEFEDRLSLGVRYRKTDINYEDSSEGDSTEHRGYVGLIYYPTKTLSFELDYQHWLTNYENNSPGYTSDQLRLNFQKRFKYYTFDAGTGYHIRSFEDSKFDDADTVSFKVSFSGQNPPPPEIKRPPGMHFIRSRSHFYVAAERNFSNYDSYYAADRFTMSLGHVFFRKILARIKGYYQMSDYEQFGGLNANREDNIYNVSGSLGYLFAKNLSLSFTAGREVRNSNFSDYDYKNNFFMLTLDFNWDIGSRGGHTEEALYY